MGNLALTVKPHEPFLLEWPITLQSTKPFDLTTSGMQYQAEITASFGTDLGACLIETVYAPKPSLKVYPLDPGGVFTITQKVYRTTSFGGTSVVATAITTVTITGSNGLIPGTPTTKPL